MSSQYDGTMQLLNISWTVTFVIGVEQNYTTVFDTYMINTSQLYYALHLSTLADSCDTFLANVKAVNEAGESDPINNVSIPSLPDIGQVTPSLTHHVWKYLISGEIHCTVNQIIKSIQLLFCLKYPALSYLLLIPEQTGVFINISLHGCMRLR